MIILYLTIILFIISIVTTPKHINKLLIKRNKQKRKWFYENGFRNYYDPIKRKYDNNDTKI